MLPLNLGTSKNISRAIIHYSHPTFGSHHFCGGSCLGALWEGRLEAGCPSTLYCITTHSTDLMARYIGRMANSGKVWTLIMMAMKQKYSTTRVKPGQHRRCSLAHTILHTGKDNPLRMATMCRRPFLSVKCVCVCVHFPQYFMDIVLVGLYSACV